MYEKDEIVAIAKFLKGEKPCYSTGIHEQVTCGYGNLDGNGFWQYELPFEFWPIKMQETCLANGWVLYER